MITHGMMRWIAVASAMILVLGLTIVGGSSARAQQASPVVTIGDNLPVAIHEGTCAAPVAEPVFDLGNAVPFGTDDEDDEDDDDDGDDVRGTAPTDPVLTAQETIGATFDDLFETAHVIAVHASPEAFGTIVACGELGGVEEDGRVVVALRPVGGSDLAGIATFDEDEEEILGIGEDEVRITVNLVTNVSGAATAPAATPVATGGEGQTVDVSLTDFSIDMPTTVVAGEVTFAVTNAGEIEHNFEVEGQGIEEEFEENLQPGETGELTLTLEPGTYEVYCPVGNHDEQGMELELTVTG